MNLLQLWLLMNGWELACDQIRKMSHLTGRVMGRAIFKLIWCDMGGQTCVNTVSCPCCMRHDISVVPWWDLLLTLRTATIKCYDLSAFSISHFKLSRAWMVWSRRRAAGGEPPLCIHYFVVPFVYEMLTHPRDGWMSSRRCPVGINILILWNFLSQVTPNGNKTTRLLSPFVLTQSCLVVLWRISVATYVCARQVWRVLQRSLSCLFNVPVSWSPSLISCCVRACELTRCWITAFTYHTCQHSTQQPSPFQSSFCLSGLHCSIWTCYMYALVWST